jgi:hypothetical protein
MGCFPLNVQLGLILKMKKEFEDIQPLDPASYNGVEIKNLIIYAMLYMEEHAIEASLNNITVITYKLFPNSFAMESFPEYPDGVRVEKNLRHLREGSYLTGKNKHGYTLSDKARQSAATIKTLTKTPGAKNPTHMRRNEILLKETKESPAYGKFLADKANTITLSELCHILQATLDTPRKVLRDNLGLLQEMAKEYKDAPLVELLLYLEKNFKEYLNGK